MLSEISHSQKEKYCILRVAKDHKNIIGWWFLGGGVNFTNSSKLKGY